MHARALKTFQGRLGMIRKGTIFQPDPHYAKQLLKNKMIEELSAEEARAAPGPERRSGPGEQREDKSIPRAPNEKQPGKEQPGSAPQTPGSDSVLTPDAGEAPKSSVSDQVPASPEKTLTTSSVGGRRAVTTPKRKYAVRQPPNPSKPDDA